MQTKKRASALRPVGLLLLKNSRQNNRKRNNGLRRINSHFTDFAKSCFATTNEIKILEKNFSHFTFFGKNKDIPLKITFNTLNLMLEETLGLACWQDLVFESRTWALLSGFSLCRPSEFTNDALCGTNDVGGFETKAHDSPAPARVSGDSLADSHVCLLPLFRVC